MERVVDYLERALVFDRLAAEEINLDLKAKFEDQAAAYRKLGANRAKSLGVELLKISN